MAFPFGGKMTPALFMGLAAMTLTACGGPQWRDINAATLSKDERTLIVEVLVAIPEDAASQCEKVTDAEVNESPSQVIIGVEVSDDCPYTWGDTLSVGYVRFVKLKLKQPLSGRTVLDSTRHQRVRIG
ncbi:hypothetical protein [Streptosporangium canum]|uniref:hypothetical protein n=1 Tax=Streptosporangium canum TaxID=324952 RepID=UPI00341CFAC1